MTKFVRIKTILALFELWRFQFVHKTDTFRDIIPTNLFVRKCECRHKKLPNTKSCLALAQCSRAAGRRVKEPQPLGIASTMMALAASLYSSEVFLREREKLHLVEDHATSRHQTRARKPVLQPSAQPALNGLRTADPDFVMKKRERYQIRWVSKIRTLLQIPIFKEK